MRKLASGVAVDPLPLVAIAVLLAITVVRVVVQRARTGDSGLRLVPRAFDRAAWVHLWLGVQGVVGVGGVIAGAAGAVAPVVAADVLVDTRVRALALALSIGGACATLACQLAMGASWRVGQDEAERTALVVAGPYRVVRNPIYSCVFLACAPIAVLVPNALVIESIAGLAVGVVALVRFVEEPFLLRVHGEAYRVYARSVGRFVPWLGRFPAASIGADGVG